MTPKIYHPLCKVCFDYLLETGHNRVPICPSALKENHDTVHVMAVETSRTVVAGTATLLAPSVNFDTICGSFFDLAAADDTEHSHEIDHTSLTTLFSTKSGQHEPSSTTLINPSPGTLSLTSADAPLPSASPEGECMQFFSSTPS